MKKSFFIKSFLFVFVLCLSAPLSAQGIVPNSDDAQTPDHDASSPIVYIDANDTKIIKLQEDAASVVVTNPETVSVLVETPRLLIAVPQQPGATSFSVLNATGDVIEKRHVIVGAPKERYIRIRRACNNSNQGIPCYPVSTYFCPNGCHQVNVVTPEGFNPVNNGDTATQLGNALIDGSVESSVRSYDAINEGRFDTEGQ